MYIPELILLKVTYFCLSQRPLLFLFSSLIQRLTIHYDHSLVFKVYWEINEITPTASQPLVQYVHYKWFTVPIGKSYTVLKNRINYYSRQGIWRARPAKTKTAETAGLQTFFLRWQIFLRKERMCCLG